MTSTAFQNLKVNDRVYIPSSDGRFIGTPVLAIDHLFRKVTVLLGRKPYSYRYIRKDLKPGVTTGFHVGLCSPST